MQDQIDQYRDGVLAMFPNAQLPEVEIVRLVTVQEWAGVIAACVSEAGFSATADTDGGVSIDLPPGQEQAAIVTDYACKAAYPIDPRYNQPLDDAQLSELYRYYVNELTPCVESFDVTVNPPPSETRFIEGGGGALWHPYDRTDQLSADVLGEMVIQCPQSP